MKRFLTPSTLVPVALAVSGVVLIMIGQAMGGRGGGPSESLAPIAAPTRSVVAVAASSPSPVAPSLPPPEPTATPTPTPLPEDVVAVQLSVATKPVAINVRVAPSDSAQTDDFPPMDSAYILRGSSQPGRNTNSYIFAHAIEHLFKPLWNAQIGDQVLVRMSNDQVLEYRVTELHPNVPCPDADADPHPNPPLALQRAAAGCETLWTQPTPEERLTLQTSQGYNRNWGEFIVIAEPAP